MDRAADNHYPTATLAQIKALVPPATRDAVLFLWTTNPKLPDALDVMAAWGFTYKTNVVWVKPKIGTGYWVRGKHELLLIGTRGHIPAPAPGTQWPSVIEALTRGHSVKPEDVYRMIEDYFPNLPKLEMFARRTRPGWDLLGRGGSRGGARYRHGARDRGTRDRGCRKGTRTRSVLSDTTWTRPDRAVSATESL